MLNFSSKVSSFLTTAIVGFMVIGFSACSHIGAKSVDKADDEKMDMGGRGLYGDDNMEPGNYRLTWSVKDESKSKKLETSAVNSNKAETDQPSSKSGTLTEKEEFELYKEWVKVRSGSESDADSEEFKAWVKFKSLR